eukprot:293634_1
MTTSAQYTWSIPSMSHIEKQLLCAGYIRNNYNSYIPEAMINLFCSYYTNDIFTINEVKNAHHNQSFISPMFIIEGLKWFLEFYPNGCNDNNEGNVMLFICLASAAPKIKTLATTYKLSIIETNTSFTELFQFEPLTNNRSYSGWRIGTLSFKNIQHLNTITIKLHMGSFIIQNQSINSTEQKTNISPIITIPKTLTLPIASFTWEINDICLLHNIKNATKDELFQSPFYAIGPFKFCLRFYPKGDSETTDGISDLFLKLMSMPPGVTKMLVQYKLFLKETNSLFRNHNSVFSDQHLSEGWDDGTLTSNKLFDNNIESLTFFIDVSLFEMYDHNQNMIDIDEKQNECHDFNLSIATELILPTAIYEWKVNDINTVKLIINANNVTTFASPVFIMHGLKWYVSFSPNGSRASRKGSLNLFLTIASFSRANVRYIVKFDMYFVECDKTHTVYSLFKLTWNGTGATDWPLKTKDIIHMNRFTFILKITLVDVYDDNEIITDKFIGNGNDNISCVPKLIGLPFDTFVYKIEMEQLSVMKQLGENGMEYTSDWFRMFGMDFFLQLYPFGKDKNDNGFTNLCIRMVEIPSDNVVVSLRYSVYMVESNVRFSRSAIFTEKRLVESWGSERYSTKTFVSLETFTIELMMELVDVYDNGQNVTHKYTK